MKVKPRRASSASPGRGLWQFQPRASARGDFSPWWLQPVVGQARYSHSFRLK
jgi:hypothetical protein